jgi:hypothetical protein
VVLHWELSLSLGWSATVTGVFAPLFTLPLITSLGHLVFSPQVTFGNVARATLRHAASFFLLFIVNRIVSLLGLVLMVVPGLYFWRDSWFLGPIVLLEGSSLRASFRRGRRFAAGYHGRVLAQAFNVGLILIYLNAALASLLHFLLVKVFGQTFAALSELPLLDGYYTHLLVLGFALALPFVTLVWFFVYLDVRIRKEGWDLELAFRARAAQLEGSRA